MCVQTHIPIVRNIRIKSSIYCRLNLTEIVQQLYLMEKLLQKMLSTANPELVQKYIDKYLPNDPDDLERIYKQLKSYQPINQDHEDGGQKIREIKKAKKLDYQDRVATENMIKRTKSLVIILKDRGLRPNQEMRDEGTKIFEKKMRKISSPLKINPSAAYLKKTNFTSLQQKYQLNKNYYRKNPQSSEPEMDKYIKRRATLQNLISEKKSLSSFNPGKQLDNKYKSIPSRAFSQQQKKQSEISYIPTIHQDSLKYRSTGSQLSSLQMYQILKECDKHAKTVKPIGQKKPGIEQNHIYDAMENKLRVVFHENHDIDDTLEKNVKDLFQKEQYGRYQNDYIKIMRIKPAASKVNKYEKDLLKNQILFRKLISTNQ